MASLVNRRLDTGGRGGPACLVELPVLEMSAIVPWEQCQDALVDWLCRDWNIPEARVEGEWAELCPSTIPFALWWELISHSSLKADQGVLAQDVVCHMGKNKDQTCWCNLKEYWRVPCSKLSSHAWVSNPLCRCTLNTQCYPLLLLHRNVQASQHATWSPRQESTAVSLLYSQSYTLCALLNPSVSAHHKSHLFSSAFYWHEYPEVFPWSPSWGWSNKNSDLPRKCLQCLSCLVLVRRAVMPVSSHAL